MNGHIKIRKGIIEHVQDAKLNRSDFGLYCYFLAIANWYTGVLSTTSKVLAAELHEDHRVIRKSMERLRDKGYINYRPTHGKRTKYPVLINKYEPTAGDHVGKRLNAFVSNDLNCPVYELLPSSDHQVPINEPSSDHQVTIKCPLIKKEEVKKEEVKTENSSMLIAEAALKNAEETIPMMYSETLEKVNKLVEGWNLIPDVKRYKPLKKYLNGDYPPSSVFAWLVDFVSSSDWETEWELILEEFRTSKFLRSGGRIGNVNSITWLFQDQGKNRDAILSGKYRDATPELPVPAFLDEKNKAADGTMSPETIAKNKEMMKQYGWNK